MIVVVLCRGGEQALLVALAMSSQSNNSESSQKKKKIRERERDRQTDRQTDSGSDRYKQSQTDKHRRIPLPHRPLTPCPLSLNGTEMTSWRPVAILIRSPPPTPHLPP